MTTRFASQTPPQEQTTGDQTWVSVKRMRGEALRLFVALRAIENILTVAAGFGRKPSDAELNRILTTARRALAKAEGRS